MGGILGRVRIGPALDVAGLASFTAGAGILHVAAGFAVAGASCLLLAWRYGE